MAILSQLSVPSKPKQYLQGWTQFYQLKFKVTPDVLIPRPETELLVDEVLKFYTLNPKPFTLIDIGTGSGNIAISLAKNLPKPQIFATDISEDALNVAKENAKKHKVESRIFFLKSDLLSNVHLRGGNINIIVTNLPYIPSDRIPYLDPSVKDFEPKLALDGGPDGFELYRKLFQQIQEKFRMHTPGVELNAQTRSVGLKLLIGEIDYTQAEIAINEANKYFPEATAEVKTDLAHKQRILIIQFPHV